MGLSMKRIVHKLKVGEGFTLQIMAAKRKLERLF